MTDQAFQHNWIVNRDADAFAELVRRHAGMAYGTCLRILRDSAAAEDAAQECFLVLAQQAHVVQPSLAFAPRCRHATDACLRDRPELRPVSPQHETACIRVQAGEL